MIRRYRIGNPIDTESVVKQLPVETGEIPFLEVNEEKKSLKLTMAKEDLVYGLGESIRGLNKRGWIYKSNNTDDPNHTEDKHSLYASQNFLLITSKERTLGLYVDAPGYITFDIGYTKLNELVITFVDFDADLYILTEGNRTSIVKEFRQLIGRSYVPPKWAFGYGQSRWSYMDEDEFRDVLRRYREAGIPIDSIYMDIDYMERYKDFTTDDKSFPNFKEFVQEMKDGGIHLVPIIDAGVKIEEGYDVYEEGVENGYFVKKENGEELVAAVWPGRVHFPDFLNEDARKWFGDKYGILLDQGIDGFWNDMNEPAIFYTEDHLKEVFEEIENYKDKNLDIDSFFAFKELVGSIDNNPEDYKRFYHNYHGEKIRHDKVHNIFGYNMTKAAGEAFERLSPEARILMFSRSSYIGMHRYGGVWTGDNKAWWSHLLVSVQQQPALNMCGFLYSGADMGGFGGDTTEDLVLRWLAAQMFTPLYRNHAAMGTRRQELYEFENLDAMKRLIQLRYAFVPYIYSEFMKALMNDEMYISPLSFVYENDDRAAEIQDQVMVGESIMTAPVVTQNVTGRYVYLPEEMKMIRFRSFEDYDEEILPAGDHYVKADLDEMVVFLRKGHVLPVAAPAETVEKLDYSTIKYITFDADPASYELYNDDGISPIA